MSEKKITRSERVAQIMALIAAGRTSKQAAEELGLSYSTVRSYLVDPTGETEKARKERHSGSCSECGGPTSGSNGREQAPSRCTYCVRGIPMRDRQSPSQPSLRRSTPIRLCDVPHEIRFAAARVAMRGEKFPEQRQDLMYAAMFPSDEVYWVSGDVDAQMASIAVEVTT